MGRHERELVDHFVHFERWRKAGREELDHFVKVFKDVPRKDSEVHLNGIINTARAMGTPMNSTTSQLFFCASDYMRYGHHVFSVGPRLQEMLCNTSVKSVPREMFRVPIPSFYLALPNCPWTLWGGKRTQWHTIGGAYFSFFTAEELRVLTETTRAALVSYPNFEFLSEPEDLKMIRTAVWGMPNKESSSFGDDANSFLGVDMDIAYRDHGGAEGMYRELTPKALWGRHTDKETMSDDPHIRDVHNASMLNVFRVAMNLLLYLTSEKAETRFVSMPRVKTRTKNPKKLRRLSKISSSTLFIVGETLERQLQHEEVQRLSDGTCRSRHWVSGYWNRYWYGKNGSLDRRCLPKWVVPHQRGGERNEGGRRVTRLNTHE